MARQARSRSGGMARSTARFRSALTGKSSCLPTWIRSPTSSLRRVPEPSSRFLGTRMARTPSRLPTVREPGCLSTCTSASSASWTTRSRCSCACRRATRPSGRAPMVRHPTASAASAVGPSTCRGSRVRRASGTTQPIARARGTVTPLNCRGTRRTTSPVRSSTGGCCPRAMLGATSPPARRAGEHRGPVPERAT